MIKNVKELAKKKSLATLLTTQEKIKMQTASTSPAFEGLLYGRMGHHLTKKIICCPHGDAKFVRFVNKIAHNNPNAI